ncbi:MAG: helix-turn-helix transcriptional regulator [Deltaproteobacteria bacterium]|nr:helix-turn-helix transcriptional regulator [Deltaproteobacteria bacterium]
MRMTITRLNVLYAFLDEPTKEHWGFALCKRLGLRSGTLYPILAKFEREGWIAGELEEIDESAEGRRKRRFYRLTEEGAREGRKAYEDSQPRRLSAPEPAEKGENNEQQEESGSQQHKLVARTAEADAL